MITTLAFLLGCLVGVLLSTTRDAGETIEEQAKAKAGFQIEIDRLKKFGKQEK